VVVVGCFGQGAGRDFDQGLQQALGKAILRQRLHRVGEVLLHDVHIGIDQAVGHLFTRQGVGLGRVEHRELRKAVRAGKRQLGLRRLARDHAAVVHFRSRGGQREHGAHGQGALHVAATLEQDVPGLAVKAGCGRHELGAVDDRAAADGEQEIDLLGAHLLHGAHQGFVTGIGLDAAKLGHAARSQRSPHLVERARLAGAGAAVQQQHARIRRHQPRQFGHLAGAKDDAGGVVELEIQHGGLLGRASDIPGPGVGGGACYCARCGARCNGADTPRRGRNCRQGQERPSFCYLSDSCLR
jgi:hypothetical protein